MTIDWSKAPEGATHYCIDSIDNTHWRNLSGETAMYWFQGRWCDHGITSAGCLESNVRYSARPAWNGDGLPPVGTVCEFQHRNAPNGQWHPTTIRYSSHAFIVYVDSIHDAEECWRTDDSCGIDFRPIRTPEQIAEEERSVAITEMKQCFDSVSDELVPTSNRYLEVLFGALHDAGYRKQVAP